MFLFKPKHIEMILVGTKTQTRRLWKKPRARVGAIHQIKETLFGRSRGAIQVLGVRKEDLLEITEEKGISESGSASTPSLHRTQTYSS
jgi:hypothetical protein